MEKMILVIDDDAADRKKVVTILEEKDYAVMEASNVEEAILKIRQTRPDLIVIDVVTANSNTTGFDICRKIKETFQDDSPRVLMITGNILGVNVSLGVKMGADDFVVKTSDMALVLRAVQNLLSRNNG